MAQRKAQIYRKRFENLSRVARKVTSSLHIADILEMIRDEVKVTVPHAEEACLLVFDKEALNYTRPLHCAVHRSRLNCQLCKRGREAVKGLLNGPVTLECSLVREGQDSPEGRGGVCEVAFPITDGEKPLAALDIIVKDGHSFDDQDLILIQDLVELAANSIINARKHWRMEQDKLTVDKILTHLRPFVPETVHRIVEKNPSAPDLQKREMDVSVLFLDVGGYTRISASLTREKVNFIIEKYFSAFLDEIYGHDGDINETAGDGLMVIFQGAPETNALNASRAALEIRRKTLEINRELEGRFEPIHVNMGVNSGPAFVGITRFEGSVGRRTTFTASGSATNLAARIASAARGGDILLGSETARRVKGKLDLHDRGVMAFKNVEKGERVFSLVQPHEAHPGPGDQGGAAKGQ